jgi:hypothetical protein
VPGIHWVTTRAEPHEYLFVQAYIELVLGLGLMLKWVSGHKDMVSVMVLAVGIAAVPAMPNAGSHFF